ncbi:metalloregulator ArsR/SmtB family transcription factor [Bacillus toyonensis]|nr:metalloregulator ArsR/SmtB family transcription factor [Bacillus toyonensis]MDT3495121.1 metalloregulator ArsR/SmtB family transcription factor [Bacillus toyonensis]MDT3495434.1 metalloregulator ArsR/SmtB family transcription factor [Bacillus toyonensis]MDT3495528.1 metalloregulator ArsR/SmtB family transcription factor [Bacillus toyonensis]
METFIQNNVQDQILEEDADLLKVIAHPVRLKIIKELCLHKRVNVSRLTEKLNIPQSTLSQHLGKMKGKVLRSDRKGLEVYYYVSNLKVTKMVEILGYINIAKS